MDIPVCDECKKVCNLGGAAGKKECDMCKQVNCILQSIAPPKDDDKRWMWIAAIVLFILIGGGIWYYMQG